MLKFLTVLLFIPVLLFSALYENRYFQDREICLNLKYIGSKKTAENWYHAFYGQVNGDNEHKYYLYIFRNTDAEPVKFQLAKLNFIEEIQAENFAFAVYKEKEVSFCYKTTKNNLYFYTELRFGDKINPDLFSEYKNSKDSFLYYSQKNNTVIMTPQVPPTGYHPGISSNICSAFRYDYDNKGQFVVKIASKDKYYITFIKPPYPFPSFEDGTSIFDASEKKLPVFESIENGLTYRIEDYNFQRIGNDLSREFHNTVTALFSQKENKDQVLTRFLDPAVVLASIPDIKETVKRNLNYYYNDSSDLFVPYGFDLSRYDVADFIVHPFEEAYRSRFRMQNNNKEFDYFLEFQKNYNSSGPVFKSGKNAGYLDFYAYLRDFSYSGTAYCTNIIMVQTGFLRHADAVIEDSFTKFHALLSGFSNGLAGLENLEKSCRNNFYDGLEDNKNMASFYDALRGKIPQVLANYQNYLNGVEDSGIAVPENLIGKTNTITDDFMEYSLRLMSDYYSGIRDKLASEYSAPDEGSFDLLSKGPENKKFQEQCRAIVSSSYAYMAKHSLWKDPENGALLDYLDNDKDINEFCLGSQFYSIDKEEFIKGLIRRNTLKKKSGDAPLPVTLKIRNPVQFYTNFFALSPAVTALDPGAEKLKAADIRALFPDFTDYIKKVSLFYNEISKSLNLKNKNNRTNENKIVQEFKTSLKSYFDIKNYFHEYVSGLKAGYTDALRDFSKISAGRNYFRNEIGLLSGGYKEFNAGTRTFFYGGDYQMFLNKLAHDALFEGIFSKSAVNLRGQKDFAGFETGYKKVCSQMVLDFNDLMKQYKSIRGRLPDFNRYDICFRTNTTDDWPQLLTRDKKKTLKESIEDRMIGVLTDTEFLNGFLDRDSLRKVVRSELTGQGSGIDLSGMMISEAGQNSISIRIGDLGYHVRGNSLVYELKRVRVIENNLWTVFSTATKIPESFVDKIDLTKTDTLTVPDSFNKMLSENKLVRGDYYDDVVMLYPGRVLLYKHGSTDNSTKYDNNLKRLSVLDYSSGKFIIRNDASAQLNKLNDLFNEKIDAIYSYYDEKKKETELIVNMRNNILFLRYNKNGFIRSNREESLLKNSFIFTEGLNKYVFKYRLTGY